MHRSKPCFPHPRVVLWILLTAMIGGLSVSSQLVAQTEEVDRERYQKIAKEYQEAVEEAVGDKKELRKLRSTTSQQLLDLVDECDNSELAIEMLNWVIKRNGNNRKSKRAFGIIIERFLDQPGIADALSDKTKVEDLESVLEVNSDPTTIAVAKMFIALGNDDEEARENALLDIKAKHGDETYRGASLTDLVAGPLSELMFRVGKVAPEIEGPDTDDVEFKLSDYRGKVVLIDFWGDW